jgi:hypothetical protein
LAKENAASKMKIDRSNYEEFVISYLDGTLSTIDTAELLIFLEQNPDLKEEAADLANYSLKPDEQAVFDFKETLIQPADIDAVFLNIKNYNHYFIAAIENDLSPAGLKAVDTFLKKNPELKKEYDLYALVKLNADKRIVFPDPRSLRKPVVPIYRRMVYVAAAAASVLILISVFLNLEPQPFNPLGENNTKAKAKNQQVVTGNADSTANKVEQISTEAKRQNQKPETKTQSLDRKKTSKTATEPTERESKILNRIPAKQILNITPASFDGATRNFYSSLFGEIVKSQEPMLASLEEEPEIPVVQPSIRTKAGMRINSILRSGAQIASQVPESFGGWMLADIGLEGINMLTDNNLKLKRIVTPDGKTGKVSITEGDSGYAFGRRSNQ